VRTRHDTITSAFVSWSCGHEGLFTLHVYQLRTKGGKRDPIKNWALPEKVFFACGACHILAYAFLKAYPGRGFIPIWIRPAKGYTGNHILVVRDQLAFDYHGYSHWATLWAHIKLRANQRWSGWNADLIELPEDVLISETKSKMCEDLHLREPGQFLFDAMPRAQKFLNRFPSPPCRGTLNKWPQPIRSRIILIR
jgi:hypothetical protein